MKRKEKKKITIYLEFLVAVILIGLLGINMRYEINNYGTKKVAKKAGANATTGTGAMGSTTNYGQALGQFKSNAKATAKKIVLLDLYDGYYTQIKIDTSALYKEGETQGMIGTAKEADVFIGKTFTNSTKIGAVGTMPDNKAVTKSLNPGDSYTIPLGYHNGKGLVTANKLDGTYNAKERRADIDMLSNNTYRYVNTNGVPNYSDKTYTAKTTNEKEEMGGPTNSYRYIDIKSVCKSVASTSINKMKLSWLTNNGRNFSELRLPLEYSKISLKAAYGPKVSIYSKDGTKLATVVPPEGNNYTTYRIIQQED